jgi:NTE family protein
MKADAVFEGGGVRGIAFIGALEVMEENGYTWEKVAGTSAGAIVAALISAGYRSGELAPIFKQMNYLYFLQRKGVGKIPLVGPACQMLMKKGLYSGDPIEQFVNGLLRKKGICTFGDLPKEKLRIIASDVSAGKMLILPDDLDSFEINPQKFPIARAVRMSSSIPYFFQPFLLDQAGQPHYIVDGGMLSNFPVWLFDAKGIPRWPTFGFRLHEPNIDQQQAKITGLITYSKALLSTMLEAHDRFYVKNAHAVRTIFIPTHKIRLTKFNLTEREKKQLFESGKQAAEKFLASWDFERYIRRYRQPQAL